ncbi:MAG: SHOCT domain-containing protein [Clostridia bacterium]|nr:SHOCT domain-containing protein [Clostridia bacterium]
MNINSKKLAIGTWILAAALFLINAFVLGSYHHIVTLLSSILSLILCGAIGFAMFRDKNDTVTAVIVVVYLILNASIPTIVLAVLVLCRRFVKNLAFIQKLWFVPALLGVLLGIITLTRIGSYYGTGGLGIIVLQALISSVIYLILGYWLIKVLDVVHKDTLVKQNQTSYLDDLLARGIITQEEYNEKVNKIKEGK